MGLDKKRKISLRPIKTWEEFDELVALETQDNQKDFADSNLATLATAFVYQEIDGRKPTVLGIYANDIPVGMLKFNYNGVGENEIPNLNESLP